MHKHNGQLSKWITTPCPCCGGNRKIINGQWLRQLRENVMMDQRTFGSMTNTSGPYISDIERNRRDCPNDILDAYMRLV